MPSSSRSPPPSRKDKLKKRPPSGPRKPLPRNPARKKKAAEEPAERRRRAAGRIDQTDIPPKKRRPAMAAVFFASHWSNRPLSEISNSEYSRIWHSKTTHCSFGHDPGARNRRGSNSTASHAVTLYTATRMARPPPASREFTSLSLVHRSPPSAASSRPRNCSPRRRPRSSITSSPSRRWPDLIPPRPRSKRAGHPVFHPQRSESAIPHGHRKDPLQAPRMVRSCAAFRSRTIPIRFNSPTPPAGP